jgi:hypothetical protein
MKTGFGKETVTSTSRTVRTAAGRSSPFVVTNCTRSMPPSVRARNASTPMWQTPSEATESQVCPGANQSHCGTGMPSASTDRGGASSGAAAGAEVFASAR